MNTSNHAGGAEGFDLEPEHAALLADLAVLVRERSEPPADVLYAAREIFTWRTIDAEIATLTFDSVLDDDVAATRAGVQPRILTFEADGLSIEVEIDSAPGGRRLLGQLVPAQAAELELRGDWEPITGTADELGRFTLPLPGGRGRVSVRATLADGTTVESAGAVV